MLEDMQRRPSQSPQEKSWIVPGLNDSNQNKWSTFANRYFESGDDRELEEWLRDQLLTKSLSSLAKQTGIERRAFKKILRNLAIQTPSNAEASRQWLQIQR